MNDTSFFGKLNTALEESTKPKLKKRNPNFEILRIVAMLMVITLHYISKGGLLDLEATSMGEGKLGFWILEAFCIFCVNVFVLITGYHMTECKFSPARIASFCCQVIFYSVVIAIIAVITGLQDLTGILNLFNLLFYCLPVTMGHYWYATAYTILLIFAPILAKAIKNLEEKELRYIILFMLIPCCFVPSIWPFDITLNDHGYTFVWFICLFTIAGYIKRYGIAFLDKKITSFIAFLASVFMIVFSRACFCIFYDVTAIGQVLPGKCLNYNYVFVLTGSISLFYFFKNLNFKDNGLVRFLCRIAPYSFGVYLIHEHYCLRHIWPVYFKVSDTYGPLRIVHWLATIILIFTAGIIIDYIRHLIFKLIVRIMLWGLKIYFAKQEVWDYLIFGMLATVVNWLAYFATAYCLLIPYLGHDEITLDMAGSIIAWVAAVIFAYWTNRTFVFKSTVRGFKGIVKEFAVFVGARLFSFAVEQGLFYFSLKIGMDDIVAKLLISVVVIVLNYIFSKLIIFKKSNE